MRLRCRDYRSQVVTDVEINHGLVESLQVVEDAADDKTLPWIAPGFFDLQVNGAGGISFNSAELTVDQVGQAVRQIHHHGVTGMLPTLVTNDLTSLTHALTTLVRSREQDSLVRKLVPGLHLEGPWISAEDGFRGAHPKQHVRWPSWDDFQRLQDAADGLVKMVTLAPELPGAIDFIERLHERNVCVGLGHTAADDKVIEAAWYAGATISTHLGNGVPEKIHRHNNPLWAQLAWGWLSASVIMDGHHIPDAVFRTIFLAKTENQMILVSDASSLAGLPPGFYQQWGHDVELTSDGKLVVVGTTYLAGSVSFLDHCVANAAAALRSEFGMPIAVDMASSQPRRLLGLPPHRDYPDSPAGFVIFHYVRDGAIDIHQVFAPNANHPANLGD